MKAKKKKSGAGTRGTAAFRGVLAFAFDAGRDALFLDIDGTLLEIASVPGDVKVPKRLVGVLARLKEKTGGALALVSGRTMAEIDALFAPLRLCAAGTHGAEWRLSPRGRVRQGRRLPKSLRRGVAESFAGMKGVAVEDKTFSVAVHYRRAPAKKDAIRKKLAALVKGREGIEIVRGRMVFEISHRGQDKGAAIGRFLAAPPFKGRRPLFFGDAEADLPAMEICVRRGGAAILVGSRKRGAKGFDSPQTVRAWLAKQAMRTNFTGKKKRPMPFKIRFF